MFWLVQQYSRLYGRVKDRTGHDLRGLGFLLRLLRKDRTLSVKNRWVWMNHEVAQCYGRLIVGDWNEPETHTFLNLVFDRLTHAGTFVDVGANVGEMIIDLACHPKVERSYAFEPIPACAEAIRWSLTLNGTTNATIIESLCGDQVGMVPYAVSSDVSNSSVLAKCDGENSNPTEMTTLDVTIDNVSGQLVILADVEGYEVAVMRGAHRLIAEHRPLIVFEYNRVSKAQFTIEDMSSAIGGGYSFWRLRRDARLDNAVDSAWNCVAVPHGSVFESVVADLLPAS